MAVLSGWSIAVSGASGFIGSALVASLPAQGAKVKRLVRSAARDLATEIVWNPAAPLDPAALEGLDAVVHLAGESIAGLWTAGKKARIRDSRVLGTRHLATALAQCVKRPRVLVCASAIGYYGDRGDEVLREDSPSGSGFLPEVCREWEAAAQPARDAGIRAVHLRFGMVASPTGRALKQMLLPFKLGLGGRMGSGRQYMSWISLDDAVGVLQYALITDSLAGPVNAVAPDSITNAEFTKTLGAVLHRPTIFPVPEFVLRILLGEMGEEILLASQRVEPARLLASGYTFKHPRLKVALEEMLKK
ncbi:MAG: TIGR01777 family oxidoreductase [Acidobacteria bacterium]|nr:TIGR01777 family oxidoreductase [Acidobacteriota bacterium]